MQRLDLERWKRVFDMLRLHLLSLFYRYNSLYAALLDCLSFTLVLANCGQCCPTFPDFAGRKFSFLLTQQGESYLGCPGRWAYIDKEPRNREM